MITWSTWTVKCELSLNGKSIQNVKEIETDTEEKALEWARIMLDDQYDTSDVEIVSLVATKK